MKQREDYRQVPNSDLAPPPGAPSREKQSPAGRKHYRGIPNFNLIPLEYRMASVSLRRLSFLLLLILLIATTVWFIQDLYQERAGRRAAIEALQGDISAIEAQLEVASAARDEAAELLTTIRGMKEQHQGLLNQRQQDWRELGVNPAEWHRVVAAVFRSPLFGVELSSIVVQRMEVALSGTAPDILALLRYRQGLLADPTISRIVSFNSEVVEGTVSFSLVARISEE